MADINDLIAQAYAGIGRSETGSGLAGITQGEKDYWAGQIASGAVTPENFQSAFNNAVNEYKVANPDDPYTQYVNNYQAQQAPSSGGIASLMTLQNAANQVQAAKAPQPLTTDVANDLMWRSMTTGVPTSEFDKYGGYEAVAKAFTNAGGQYDRSTIPTTNLQQYAQTIANTGVGDLNTLTAAGIPLTEQAIANMKANGIDQSFIDKARQTYELDPYAQLVQQQYATIGRQGAGEGVANIKPSELQYWEQQLASGAIKKEDLPKAFAAAVLEYKKEHPEDPYTKYVNEYQLGQQTEAMKTGIGNVLADNKISLAEANEIQSYYDNYMFKPEDIARVTGQPLSVINQVLGARSNILGQGYEANVANPLGLVDYATANKLSAKDLASASKGAMTEAQATELLNKGNTFQGRLQLAAPDAYNKIASTAQFDADRYYNGQIQDYQVQILSPLDTAKSGIPQKIDIVPAKTEKRIGYDENNQPYEYEAVVENAHAKNGSDFWLSEDADGKIFYSSNKPVNVNGVPVYAQYDANGKIAGYTGYEATRVFLPGGDSGSISGKWDAAGNVITQYHRPGGSGGFAGFMSDIGGGLHDIFGDAGWTVAKLFPATAPYANAIDAINAYNKGDMKGAVTNAIASYAGYQSNVATDALNPSSVNYANAADAASDVAATGSTAGAAATANAANARLALATVGAYDAATAKNPNYTPLLNVAASVSGIAQNPTAATAFNTLGVVNAAANNDMSGLFNAAGNLTGNKDLNLAAAANNFRRAYESGNQSAIITAGSALTTAAENSARTSGAVDTIKNFINNSIPAVKGESISIVDQLKNSGLTDTTPEDRAAAFSTVQNYQPKEGELSVNVYNDPQLAAGDGYTGGLGGSPYRPGFNVNSSTGQAFFATFDEAGNLLSRVPVVREGNNIVAAYASDAAQLESGLARMGIKNPTIPNEVMQALIKLNPSLGDTKFVPGSSAASIDELAALLGKDIIDMPSKTTAQTVSKLDDALAVFKNVTKASPWSTLFDLATYTSDAGAPEEISFEEARKLQDLWRALQPTALTPVIKKDVGSAGREVANVSTDTVVAYDPQDNPITVTDILNDIRSTPTFQAEHPEITVTPTAPKNPTVSITPPTKPPVVKPTDTVVTPPPVSVPPTTVTPPVTATTPTTTTTPSATPSTTPSTTTPTTTTAQSTGLNFGQVQQALAAAGIPELANVFYYGKEFGSKKQKLNKKGELEEEEYNPLSVTKAGAAGELEEQVAEQAKTKENDINTALEHILGASSNSTSLDDLLNIVKGA